MDFLTWQLVVVLIGGITAFLSFLYAMIGKNTKPVQTDPWKGNVNTNIAVIEQQIESIRAELASMKNDIDDQDEKTKSILDKFETKI
jgi:peptidoglycan hydrolase CwlO-like protein